MGFLDTLLGRKKDEPRVSRLVFIGRDLPEEAIRSGFDLCVAA